MTIAGHMNVEDLKLTAPRSTNEEQAELHGKQSTPHAMKNS